MAKTNAIGHTQCHICGFNDAEVKLDKNGKAYLFCPDCNIQSFTRYEHQSGKLLAKMRPVTVTEGNKQENEKPHAEAVQMLRGEINDMPPKKAGFNMGL